MVSRYSNGASAFAKRAADQAEKNPFWAAIHTKNTQKATPLAQAIEEEAPRRAQAINSNAEMKLVRDLAELLAAAPEYTAELNDAYMLGYEKGRREKSPKTRDAYVHSLEYGYTSLISLHRAVKMFGDEKLIDELALDIAAAEGALEAIKEAKYGVP